MHDGWPTGLVTLRTLVSSNAETLRQVHDGLNHTCLLPTDQIVADIRTAFGFLAGSGRLAQLLQSEAQLRELEGHPEEAALIYAQITRFGNEVSRGGVSIHRSSGITCESLGLSRLVKLVPNLDCAQARAAIVELEKLEADRVSWQDIAEADKQLTHHERVKRLNPVDWVKDWWQTRGYLRSAEARHNLALAHSRLVMLELALRCYRSDHGEPPAQLAQLAPTYLNRIPSDPFGGTPFIYRPKGTNWLLYSVGFDKVDDGGKPASRSVKSTGDVFYDSSW